MQKSRIIGRLIIDLKISYPPLVNNIRKKSIVNTKETINFIATPAKKPIRVPNEALIAFFIPLSFKSSPENAPMNGPEISPTGPRKKPSKRPIVAPINPFFDPPSFFKPIIGMIKSKKNTEIAIVKHPIIK